MNITIFSDAFNHLHMAFSKAMYQRLGDGFKFVTTTKPSITLENKDYPYLVHTYKNKDNHQKALELAIKSDVVILANTTDKYIKERIKSNKLTFRYSERLNGEDLPKKHHKLNISKTMILSGHKTKALYLLTGSSLSQLDMKIYEKTPKKCLTWGYFPIAITYDISKLISNKPTQTINIIWIGELTDSKNPMVAIRAIHQMALDGYQIAFEMIGSGGLIHEMKDYINKNGLEEIITLKPSCKPDELNAHLEKANIYLMTASSEEGWGHNIGLAMNRGCAALINYEIGSAPHLIDQFRNGVLYIDEVDLSEKLALLIKRKSYRETIGKEAYLKIMSMWHPKIAAQRLIDFSTLLLKGDYATYEKGPLSYAKLIKPTDVYRHIRDVKAI